MGKASKSDSGDGEDHHSELGESGPAEDKDEEEENPVGSFFFPGVGGENSKDGKEWAEAKNGRVEKPGPVGPPASRESH